MLITLIRTGGFIPITKKAEKEVDWSESEMRQLLDQIEKKDEGPGQARDATEYQLMYNAGTFSIDWDKIPAKYKKMFDELKDNLAIVKPG
jgi:hypothetical protein